ncbi:fatty acid desaturase family protein [Kordiimonas pumila]|uniref:Fatty acid desaturase family protein n=1 Tax=Kordiimonas pumila TaxID=2161677 RepID=A0ABV7D718_9PROT|nr:fatty acid desaturase family protein [Kordiimonas pumila]
MTAKSTQWRAIKPGDIVNSEESHHLRQRSNIWGFWLIAHCWATIGIAIALYAFFPSALTLILGIIIVGGRQLGLAILMHEGSHGLLFRNRALNERMTQWFTAWPMILNVHAYRVRHMAHHRFTRTDKDPENYLYTPFPVTKSSMIRKFARDLSGVVFLRTNYAIFRFIWGDPKGRSTRLIGFYAGPLLFNGLMATAFAYAGRIDLWLLLWLLPLATTYQLFLRIRNIAEHATVPNLTDSLKNSRTTLANVLERATVAPYWVNYHIEHHMLPFVPCYRLPFVHTLMRERGFADRMEIRMGYRDIIRLNASA